MKGSVQAHISDQAHVYVWRHYKGDTTEIIDDRLIMQISFRSYEITIAMPGCPEAFARALISPKAEAAEWAQAPGWGVILVTPGTVIADCGGVHMTMSPEQAADLGREILRSI